MPSECCQRRAPGPGSASAIAALAGVVGALLVPKCPFCLAGYLAVIGVGAGLAEAVHPLLVPLCLGAAMLFAGAALVRVRRGDRSSARWRP